MWKNKLAIWGSLIVLVITLLMGCDIEDKEDKEESNPFKDRSFTFDDGRVLTFASSTWGLYNSPIEENPYERNDFEGTYTYDGNIATMTPTRFKKSSENVWYPHNSAKFSTVINKNGSVTFYNYSPPPSRSAVDIKRGLLNVITPITSTSN